MYIFARTQNSRVIGTIDHLKRLRKLRGLRLRGTRCEGATVEARTDFCAVTGCVFEAVLLPEAEGDEEDAI